jgi:nucleotide-binding universal stress UspA family protein
MIPTERNIIIGVDYSDFCIPAVDEALLMAAAAPGTRLVPLLALPGSLPAPSSDAAEVTADVVTRSKENLVRLVESRARTLGLTLPAIEPWVAFGEPAENLLAEARRRKATLIAVGTHGRRGLQHLLLGSVAEDVLKQAPCSVLIARAQLVEASTLVDETTEPWATGEKSFDPESEAALDAAVGSDAQIDSQIIAEPHLEADRVVLHVLDGPSNQVFVCSFEDAETVAVDPLEGAWVPAPSSAARARAGRAALKAMQNDPALFGELFAELERRRHLPNQ